MSHVRDSFLMALILNRRPILTLDQAVGPASRFFGGPLSSAFELRNGAVSDARAARPGYHPVEFPHPKRHAKGHTRAVEARTITEGLEGPESLELELEGHG